MFYFGLVSMSISCFVCLRGLCKSDLYKGSQVLVKEKKKKQNIQKYSVIQDRVEEEEEKIPNIHNNKTTKHSKYKNKRKIEIKKIKQKLKSNNIKLWNLKCILSTKYRNHKMHRIKIHEKVKTFTLYSMKLQRVQNAELPNT